MLLLTVYMWRIDIILRWRNVIITRCRMLMIQYRLLWHEVIHKTAVQGRCQIYVEVQIVHARWDLTNTRLLLDEMFRARFLLPFFLLFIMVRWYFMYLICTLLFHSLFFNTDLTLIGGFCDVRVIFFLLTKFDDELTILIFNWACWDDLFFFKKKDRFIFVVD